MAKDAKGEKKKKGFLGLGRSSPFVLSEDERESMGETAEKEREKGEEPMQSPFALSEEEMHPPQPEKDDGQEEKGVYYVELPIDRELEEEEADLFDEEQEEGLKKGDHESIFTDQKGGAKKKKRRKWYGIPVGVLVLSLALVGVIFLGTQVYQYVYRVATDDSAEREYDTFLSPVVMLDPEPFETIEAADKKMVLQAALWQTVFENQGDAVAEYDEYGRMVLQEDKVNENAVRLFGVNCILTPMDIYLPHAGLAEGSPEATIAYNASSGTYHVPMVSMPGSYRPYVESIKKKGGVEYLRVAYQTVTDQGGDNALVVESRGPETVDAKYMEYEISFDDATKLKYISAIREVEQ